MINDLRIYQRTGPAMPQFDEDNRPYTYLTALTDEVFVNLTDPTAAETEQLNREQNKPQPIHPEPVTASETKVEEQVHPAQVENDDAASFQSLPKNFYNLSFACVLIPRFSDHFLVGDITDTLPVWMKEVCVSYSWRLDAITIRPGYMQWGMTVPPTANPAQFMRIARQHTSAKIFADFPRFRQKNVSSDFWAPGYFVIPGNASLSQEMINAFIVQTRNYQGIA